MFQPVYTFNFELGLLCILCIVIAFDVPVTFLDLQLATEGTFNRV